MSVKMGERLQPSTEIDSVNLLPGVHEVSSHTDLIFNVSVCLQLSVKAAKSRNISWS